MSDQANNEPFWFREEKKRIVQNFIDQESKHKTLEDDAKDAADWLAQLSRLSQNVTKSNPESGGIDAKSHVLRHEKYVLKLLPNLFQESLK